MFCELDPIFQQMFEKVALGKILDMANQLALMTELKNKVLSACHVFGDTLHYSGQYQISCIHILRNFCSTVFEITLSALKGRW